MKKTLLFFIVAGIIISCNSNSKTTETTENKDNKEEAKPAEATEADIKMPYTATYSSQFTVADQKISEKILTLFKQWDDNKLADGKSMFADSISFFADKWAFTGTRDSFFTVSQQQRSNYKEVKTVVHAWIPVHSTDKNEDWALIWSTAYTTDMKGKVDSASYQDTWRLNKSGQFDLMYDFQAKAPPPPKKK